jgi:hypothetical protein
VKSRVTAFRDVELLLEELSVGAAPDRRDALEVRAAPEVGQPFQAEILVAQLLDELVHARDVFAGRDDPAVADGVTDFRDRLVGGEPGLHGPVFGHLRDEGVSVLERAGRAITSAHVVVVPAGSREQFQAAASASTR